MPRPTTPSRPFVSSPPAHRAERVSTRPAATTLAPQPSCPAFSSSSLSRPALVGRWLAGLLLVGAVGCAEFRTLPLSDRPAHSHPNRQPIEEIYLAAELLATPAASEYQFGTEFRRAGFFAVLFHLENRGTRPFEIRRSEVALVLENGDTFTPQAPADVIRQTERSHSLAYVSAPLIIPPFFIYQHVRDYNLDLARNVIEKAFPRSFRLEPGDSPRAFALFFHEPQLATRPRRDFSSAVLRVAAELEGARAPSAGSSAATPAGTRVSRTAGSGSAATTATPRHSAGQVAGPGTRSVGRTVTFTLSVTPEDQS